jgi:hypothetical protein
MPCRSRSRRSSQTSSPGSSIWARWRRSRGDIGKNDVEALTHELRLLAARLEGLSEKERGEVVEAVAEAAEDDSEA